MASSIRSTNKSTKALKEEKKETRPFIEIEDWNNYYEDKDDSERSM